MVDTREYAANDFVSASAEWHNKTGVFVETPEFINSDRFNKTQLVGKVEIDKKQYKMSINKSNARRLQEKWGFETTGWVGKPFLIEVATMVTKTNEVKKTLVLTPNPPLAGQGAGIQK